MGGLHYTGGGGSGGDGKKWELYLDYVSLRA